MAKRAARSFTLQVIALGAIPCLLLIGLAASQLLEAVPRISYARNMVVHTFDVIQSAQSLEIAVQGAERNQRNYLMTVDPVFLEPYDKAVAVIPKIMTRLQTLTADNAEQQNRILALQSAVTTRMDGLARGVEMAKNGAFGPNGQKFTAGAGTASMTSFVGLIAEFIDTENRLLTTRLEAAGDAERRTRELIVIGCAVALAMLMAGAFSLSRAFSRIRRSETTLQATLDNVREGVGAFDRDKKLVAWNTLFVDLLNLPPGLTEQGQSLGVLEALDRDRTNPVIADLSDLAERSRRSRTPIMLERLGHRDRLLELYVNHEPDSGFLVTFSDITERRQTENFYRQAQKMEALGQMTGGVAHDFNNLLTIIIGCLDRLTGRVQADPGAIRLIDMAMTGAERGAKLNHQLLAFARKQPLEPKVINPSSLMGDIIDLIGKSVGEQIKLELVGSAGLWTTLIDPTQFEAAVLNLAFNARDAMAGDGSLTIELANVSLDEAYAARHDEVTAGQYVMLAVTDTGAGMAPDVVSRAFDPFFTTKQDGKGTGLGLSQVYGFVKQSAGHVKIYSEIGHGTTIKLYLPRHGGVEEAAFAASPSGDLTGSETVLVVEDDDDVRNAVTGLLGDLGYRVLEAENGASALTVLETDQPIDLLFTDVIMPGSVSSRVLAETAKELRPGIKVLFTSGYTENSIVHNGRLDPGLQLLSKPYRREQLAQKIRSVLAIP